MHIYKKKFNNKGFMIQLTGKHFISFYYLTFDIYTMKNDCLPFNKTFIILK